MLDKILAVESVAVTIRHRLVHYDIMTILILIVFALIAVLVIMMKGIALT